MKSILTSPSLEKLGWEEKLLALETAVLVESLPEFMEAGQHCINASDVSCPWHRDLLNVDLARGVQLFMRLLLIFNTVDPCERPGLSDCCWISPLFQTPVEGKRRHVPTHGTRVPSR